MTSEQLHTGKIPGIMLKTERDREMQTHWMLLQPTGAGLIPHWS